ncbi:MAG: DinB family protein [Chitinophagaceae bacterium]
MARPDLSRVPSYFHNYIRQAEGESLPEIFRTQLPEMTLYLKELPPAKQGYRYAEGKWTVKEVLQHIIDAERVFAYRALCIARQDKTSLPAFDENLYADTSLANHRVWEDLVEEFLTVRRSTELLYQSFNQEQLETSGTASGKSIYVLGLGFVIAGHAAHHFSILKSRY